MDSEKKPASAVRKRLLQIGPPAAVIIALIAVWQLVSAFGGVDPKILPSPWRIITKGFEDRSSLWTASLLSLRETVLGLLLGTAEAFGLSIVIDAWDAVRRSLYPLLVSFQTIPVVALAPIFIIWFGFGLLPKVLLVALYTAFPIVIGLSGGMAATPKSSIDIMKTLGYGKWDIIFKVKLPSALPQFFSGLRVAASYAFGTAVIGEFMGAANGIGIYLTGAKSSFRTDLVFAGSLAIIILTLILYALVILIEKIALPWQAGKGGRK